MCGLTELEHHIVGGVDHIVDRPHPRECEATLEPCRRGSHLDVLEDGHAEARAQFGI